LPENRLAMKLFSAVRRFIISFAYFPELQVVFLRCGKKPMGLPWEWQLLEYHAND